MNAQMNKSETSHHHARYAIWSFVLRQSFVNRASRGAAHLIYCAFVSFVILVCLVTTTNAAEPIKALMITGGCCHDYEQQKKILSEGISARANVTWTIIHEGDADGKNHKFSIYEKPDWAKGFDVVLHNECSGGVTNVEWVERIAKAHFD